MGFDEREDSRPRIIGVRREPLLLTVEEALRRPFVADDLVLDARGRQRLLERRDLPTLSLMLRELPR